MSDRRPRRATDRQHTKSRPLPKRTCRMAELRAALRRNEEINRALRESEARFRGLAQQSLVGIAIIEDGKFTYTNPKFNDIFGYSAAEVLQVPVLDTVMESDRPMIAEKMRQRISGEIREVELVFHGLRKDGTVIDVELHGGGMDIGGKVALIGVLLDVTERIRAERAVHALQEQLRDQSTHDALTGLYNRRYLDEVLERELIAAARQGWPVSVILGDLDRFKGINDRHGHLAGDEVLRIFAGLVRQHARGSDVCCRYGGEEFLLVLPRMPQKDAVERAEELRAALHAAPVIFGAESIAVTASFGVATYPGDGRSVDALIAAADHALYAAKESGRNRVTVNLKPNPPAA